MSSETILPPQSSPDATVTPPPTESEVVIERQIGRTCRRVKGVDLVEGVMLLTIGTLGYLFLVAILDHWLLTGGLGAWSRWLFWLVLVTVAVAFFVYRLLPPLVKRIHPLYAASTIEQSQPTLKNSLINFLMLRGHTRDVAPVVYRAMEQRAATDLAKVELDAAVDETRAIRMGYVLAAVFAICCLYLVLSPKNPLRSAARVLLPWASIEAPTRVTIHNVEPGDGIGQYGDFVTIQAEVAGLRNGEQAMVIYSTEDGQTANQAVPMTQAEGDYRSQCRLPPDSAGMQQDLTYQIVAGDCRTRRYHLVAQIAPVIVVDKISYHFPAYTGLANQTIEHQGDLRAIEGTEVTIHATTNTEIKPNSAEIDLGCTGRQGRRMTVEDRTVTGHFTMRLNPNDPAAAEYDSYQLRFAEPQGRENTHPIRHRVEVIRDLPPEVQLLEPKQQEVSLPVNDRLNIQVRAADPDFGLRRVTLRAQQGDKSLPIAPLLDQRATERAKQGEFTGTYAFEPTRLGLKPGDLVEYWAEAEDNKEPSPNRTASEKRRIAIVAPTKNPSASEQPKENEPPRDQGKSSQDKKRSDAGKSNDTNGKDQNGTKNNESQNLENKTGTGDGDKNRDQKPEQKDQPNQDPSSKDQPKQDPSQPKNEQKQNQPGESSKSGEQSGSSSDQSKQNDQQPSQSKDQQSGGSSDGQQQGNKGDAKPNEKIDPNTDPGGAMQEILKDREAQKPSGDASPKESQGDKQSSGDKSQDKPSQGEKSEGSQGNKDQRNAQQPSGEKQQGQPQQGQKPGEKDQKTQPQPGSDQPQQGEKGESSKEGKAGDNKADSQQPGDKGGASKDANEKGSEGKQQGKSDQKPSGSEQSSGKPGDQESTGQKGDKNGSAADKEKGKPTGEEKANAKTHEDAQPGERKKSDATKNDQTGTDQKPPEDMTGGKQSGNAEGGKDQSGSSADKATQHKKTDKKPEGGKQGEAAADDQNRSAPKSDQPSSSGKPGEKTGTDAANQQGKPAPDNKKPDGTTADKPEGVGKDGEPSDSEDAAKADGSSAPKDASGKPGKEKPSESKSPEKTAHDKASQEGKPGGTPSGESGQKPGEKPSGGSPTGGGQSKDGTNVPPPENADNAADEANLQYTKRQTELALEHLRDQLAKEKPGLLEKLGWTKEDAQRFLNRWEAMQRAAAQKGPEGEAARKQLSEALKSLGLRPHGTELRRGGVQREGSQNLHDAGRFAPPPDWADQFREYTRGVAGGKQK
jgi:hypothetical protein